eukprot:560115_1
MIMWSIDKDYLASVASVWNLYRAALILSRSVDGLYRYCGVKHGHTTIKPKEPAALNELNHETQVPLQSLYSFVFSTYEDEDVKEKEEKEEQDDDLGQNEEDEHSDLIRFDSKMKVLMNELKKIKKKKPKEKSLIFTSFSKSLEWICSELRRHGLQYRTLCGSMTLDKRKKQLAQFADNPEVKVFVLTVRTGAVGITLTSANHVFMLEPTFNAALHRQAINRVYRLGQKKKVFIHTMIMKDSIEERIWNINKHKKEDETDVAGSINADTKAKLQKHEISKLFQ